MSDVEQPLFLEPVRLFGFDVKPDLLNKAAAQWRPEEGILDLEDELADLIPELEGSTEALPWMAQWMINSMKSRGLIMARVTAKIGGSWTWV